jgi:primosomal protein N' (replication factor Y)
MDRHPEGLVYSVAAHTGAIDLGDHVAVPLGRGHASVDGVVVAVGGVELAGPEIPAEKIKSVRAVHRDTPPLPRILVRLAQWIASYYCAPIGVTLQSMTPSAVRTGVGRTTRLMVDLVQPKPEGAVHPARRKVLDALAAMPASQRPCEARTLAAAAGARTLAAVRALIQSGHLTAVHQTTVQAKWRSGLEMDGTPPALTQAQQSIVDSVGGVLGSFSQHLLFGVTGSGKTEVYLRLAERVLSQGKSVLWLVPEIALTPQAAGRVMARLPKHRVAMLHSGLTAAQRHEQWLAAGSGEPKVVLGARSAVFAPFPDGQLGLIVVDEEHDSSYKQDQAPRYHGRDVAIRRAHLAECPVLLGSATPSLESWWNATRRSVATLHRLPDRAPGLVVPRVDVVDFRAESMMRADRRVRLIGPSMEHGLRRALEGDGQAIVLLNRRGYANWIACPDHACGWTLQCDHCEAGMVVHQLPEEGGRRITRCHHCAAEQRVPMQCPRCNKRVSIFGLGTQKVEEELQRMFPELDAVGGIERVDSDTMERAEDFHEVLGRFARGEIRLLLGTQMIAKGLDFPRVRMVGVISADTALNMPDFRASERTFQLVAQVSGRCGRGSGGGRAVIQTFQPDSDAIQSAARGDYEGFAGREVELRERHRLPPVHRMARLVVRHHSKVEATRIAASLRGGLVALPESRGCRVSEPAPCPVARIADRWRVQVEVVAETAGALQKLMAAARSRGVVKPGEVMAVDIDPAVLL